MIKYSQGKCGCGVGVRSEDAETKGDGRDSLGLTRFGKWQVGYNDPASPIASNLRRYCR